jgi:hypothetical protein
LLQASEHCAGGAGDAKISRRAQQQQQSPVDGARPSVGATEVEEEDSMKRLKFRSRRRSVDKSNEKDAEDRRVTMNKDNAALETIRSPSLAIEVCALQKWKIYSGEASFLSLSSRANHQVYS